MWIIYQNKFLVMTFIQERKLMGKVRIVFFKEGQKQ